jgi:hypothetical protein
VRLRTASFLSLVGVIARLTVLNGHECDRLHPVLDSGLCNPAGFEITLAGAHSENKHKHESCPICQSYEAQSAATVPENQTADSRIELSATILLQSDAILYHKVHLSHAARAPPA